MVQGGQTVINPWLILGGVATAICTQKEMIIPENAVVGDVLILTKPLGTQVGSFAALLIHLRLADLTGRSQCQPMVGKRQSMESHQVRRHRRCCSQSLSTCDGFYGSIE